MLAKTMLTFLTLTLAAWLPALDLVWDFADPKVWDAAGDPRVEHDFGPLHSMSAQGAGFVVDKKYQKIIFGNASEDLSRYPILEIFHYGDGMLFSILPYGKGESGYEGRISSYDWGGNERYYPKRDFFDLRKNPRWQKGNINSFHLVFSNSGEGSDFVITAAALRRGIDTLENGALALKDSKNRPLYWEFSKKMQAGLVRDKEIGWNSCKVSAGQASTALNSVIIENRYTASVFVTGACRGAEILIFDQDGRVLERTKLKKEKKVGRYTLLSADYAVRSKRAYRGQLRLDFSGAGAFADAMVEDKGSTAVNWNAYWIWSSEEMKHGQSCYFRKEFTVDDPESLKSAFIQATCDDAFALEVNNNRIMSNNNWSVPHFAEVKKYLVKGKNVITAGCWNNTGWAGFLAELTLTDRNGKKRHIASDDTWLARLSKPSDHWRRIDPPAESLKGWSAAKKYYQPPWGPWGGKVIYRTEPPEAGAVYSVDKEKFAARKSVARINKQLKHPRLEVNGEIMPPMIFGIRPRGDRTESYKTVQASGFKVFRLGWEFSFEALREDGSVDYSGLEKDMTELLASVPDAKVILMFRISPPSSWTNKYPDELIKFADGRTTGADGVFASPASEIFRKEAGAKVAEVVRYLENSWFSSAIIGYMPCNMRGPEWVIPARQNCFPDYSKPMQKFFREYLRSKYRSDAELQKAWQNPQVTLDTAEIPKQDLRKLDKGYFLKSDRQDVFDYNRAYNQANVDTIISIIDQIHAAAPDKLRVLYFGYLMTLDHTSKLPVISGHYDLLRLLALNKVDVMVSPVSYIWRSQGDISGIGTVESSFVKHGVLWIQEADNRTYLSNVSEEMLTTFNAADSLRENWREFTYALLKRQSIWFYELGGGWYDNPYFHADFRKMMKICRAKLNEKNTYQAPMAYFFDEKVFDGVSLSDNRWAENRPFCLAASAQRMAAVCGVPYDIFELEDIFTLDLSPYKVLVFPNAWRKNARLEKLLAEKVYPAGKSAVWVYGAGYGQKGGLSGMKALTGMDFELMPEKTPLTMMTPDGRITGSPGTRNAEMFTPKVPAEQVLAVFPGTDKAAAAWQNIGSGRSVWMNVFDCNGALLRNELIRCGIVPLVDHADRVVCDGSMLGVFVVDAPGMRNVSLPVPISGKVVDVISGESFNCINGKFKFYGRTNDIRLFQYR